MTNRGRETALKHYRLAFYFAFLYAIGIGALGIYLYDFSPPSFIFGVQLAFLVFSLLILVYSMDGIEQIYHYIESLERESDKKLFNRRDA